MDAHLFRLFANAAEPYLQGARIEKIRQPAGDIIAISLYNHGKKRILYLRYGKKGPFCFLSLARAQADGQPQAWVMRLRKYFQEKRIAAAVFQIYSRRLWLLASNAGMENTALAKAEFPKAAWLCLDLTQGPSLNFLAPNESPEAENPVWPETGQLACALEQWRDWPMLTPALRRTMRLLEEKERWALLEDLKQGNGDVFAYVRAGENEHGQIAHISAWPLPPELVNDCREQDRQDILEALADYGQQTVLASIFQAQTENLLMPVHKRARHIHKILRKMESDQAKLEAMLNREADAMSLAENLWRWPPDLRLESISVPSGAHGPQKSVMLDRRFSVRENMQKMFHAARRGKRGMEFLRQRRQELLDELATLENLPEGENTPRKDAGSAVAGQAVPGAGQNNKGSGKTGGLARALQKILPKNVQVFVSSDGYTLLRGKDAKGNMAARRFAAGHDIWAHVENGPGAHVIIRMPHPGHAAPETTLEEAGSLAACKSWLCDASAASVMYAEIRHVKAARKGPAGKMIIDKTLFTRVVPVDHDAEKRLLYREQNCSL